MNTRIVLIVIYLLFMLFILVVAYFGLAMVEGIHSLKYTGGLPNGSARFASSQSSQSANPYLI